MKSGMRPLGRALGALLRPALRRRGFAVSEILTRWPLIVGEALAQKVAPERVRFPMRFPQGGHAARNNRVGAQGALGGHAAPNNRVGAQGAQGSPKQGDNEGRKTDRNNSKSEAAVLHLRVAPGFGPEVQHLEPLIVERINSYYGFRAVGRLKLVQGPLPAPRQRPSRPLRPLLPAEEDRLNRLVGAVGDAGLRDALAQLGRNIVGKGLR